MASHVDYRCFSKELYLSKILTLSVTERDLLTYCILLADDRGITPAYTALKLTSARETDLQQLVKKNYLHILRSEDYLCFILDWEIHQKNMRSDRMKESDYIDLLKKDFPFLKLREITKRADKKTDNGNTNLDVQRTSNGHPTSSKYKNNINFKDKDNINSKVTTPTEVIFYNKNNSIKNFDTLNNKGETSENMKILNAAFAELKISLPTRNAVYGKYPIPKILECLEKLKSTKKQSDNVDEMLINMLKEDLNFLRG